jgi:hypothetical protein
MKQIEDDLYRDILSLLEKRNKALYQKMLELKDVDMNINLSIARATKTNNKKNEMKKAIIEIAKIKHRKPTKYELHTKTKIAYVTINKYFDEIIDETNK